MLEFTHTSCGIRRDSDVSLLGRRVSSVRASTSSSPLLLSFSNLFSSFSFLLGYVFARSGNV